MVDVDRSDPDLKFLVVDRNAFSDPATQAEWAQKRLVWVPHETAGFVAASMKGRTQGEEVEVEIVETGKKKLVPKECANNTDQQYISNRYLFRNYLFWQWKDYLHCYKVTIWFYAYLINVCMDGGR